MKFVRIAKYVSLIVALLAGNFLFAVWIMGQYTEYCPWSHVVSTTESCVVRHRQGERVLIEHRNLDLSRDVRTNYFEIREGSASYLFALPLHIPDSMKSAALIPGERSRVSINGQSRELVPLEHYKERLYPAEKSELP
jgi:hypothetical protein